ncbi:hypothetical protein ACVWZL_003248 [Bradyrhizobium sp. GM2.4]
MSAVESPIWKVADALFARYCERARARGHQPHHPPGTPVSTMPPSYSNDYAADARAALAAAAEVLWPIALQTLETGAPGLSHQSRHAVAVSMTVKLRGHAGPSPQCSEENCPGHVAWTHNPKICANCGVHIDSLRPPEDEQ